MEQEERTLRPIRCVRCGELWFGDRERLGKTNFCDECKPIFKKEFEEFNKQRTQYLNETGKPRL